MPEKAVLLLVFHLGVRKGGDAVRAPVDNAVAPVDQPLVVKVDKDLTHRTGTALVHGEALTAPVAGGAKLFQLADDAVAVLLFPVPHTLQKLFTSQVVAGQSLVDTEIFLHLDLGGDARMVGAGNPQGVEALHSLVAHQNVLERFIQGVSHVELSGYVGGRNDHRKGGGGIVDVGREITLVAPVLVDPVLKVRGGIYLRKFVARIHNILHT